MKSNLPVDYYTNPYTVKRSFEERKAHITNIATLAKLHLEADSVPGYDYPITDEEFSALWSRAKEGVEGLHDALVTAFGVGMARWNK